MAGWKTLPGETPIDDISGLKIKGIVTPAQLNDFEGANIRSVASPKMRPSTGENYWPPRTDTGVPKVKQRSGTAWGLGSPLAIENGS